MFWSGLGCGGGGGTTGSGSGGSQNPAPILSSISPTTEVAGSSAFTLVATGSNFIASSLIEWNGAALSTTFNSSTSLQAQVPASDITSTGTANITVVTPAPGGGTSSALAFTISPPPNPVPTLTSLSPASTMVGSAATTLTVTGTNFISSSQVLWNGSPLTTAYVSATSLTAQIPASDLTSTGIASVSVQNPAPGGGTSSALTFTIGPNTTTLSIVNIPGNDVAWSPVQNKLYVSVPGSSGTYSNAISAIDPVTGSVVPSQSLSSTPYGLALSDDGTYLYTAINSGQTIQRLNLPSLTADIQWSLGTAPITGGTYYAGDMKVQPSAAHTLAVSLESALGGTGVIAIFDDGVQRPQTATFVGNGLQWKADGTQLFSANAAYTDSPYTTRTSNDPIEVVSVTASGASLLQTYGSALRTGTARLHYDAATGYLYSDEGQVVNSSTGVPIGNYPWTQPSTYGQVGPLLAVDPILQRVYILNLIQHSGGTYAYEIQSFDQTHFKLLSTLIIPGTSASPENFVRWGQSGLAFVTNDFSGGGALYILDGGFVNPSGSLDTSAGTAVTPVPTLTAVTPLTATTGSGAINLTATGYDFTASSTLYWNGTALPTTAIDSTDLQTQIPASDLAAAAQVSITASNSSSDLPASNSVPFSVNPAPPAGNQITVYNTGGNDLVWDTNAEKIYVSMPGIQGDQGDSLAIVDPVASTVTNSGFIGSDPANLSISSDGDFLYTALYGQNSIAQLSLPDFTVANSWNLGADSFLGPYYALSLQAAPNAPQTTAVTLANFDVSPSDAGVVVFDGSTPRANKLTTGYYDYSGLQWGSDNATLYAVSQDVAQSFFVLGVNTTGLTLNQTYNGILNLYSPTIHFDAGTGLVYTDQGQVVQPSNGTIVGSYGASGIALPDSALGRTFILGQTAAQVGTQNYTIESFDQTTFTAISSIVISNVVGTPTAFICWGTSGLAFTTRVGNPWDYYPIGPGQLYVINGNFVNPSANSINATTEKPTSPVHRTWNLTDPYKHRSQLDTPNP